MKVKSLNERNQFKDFNDKETQAANIRDSTENLKIVRVNCYNPSSEAYLKKYKLINTYIPDAKDDVKYININFNIFQDYNGKNNFSPSINSNDIERLQNMLAWINEIYAKQPYCEESQTYNSDPPAGANVKDLDKKFIQFKLVGIYEYKDKTPDESLWKSNNSRLLLNRIAEVDSNRLSQINICFTEKYYLGSVREIKIIKGGENYSHPCVTIKDKSGKGAKAIVNVMDGQIKSIEIVDGGSNYSSNVRVEIKGGGGKGAKAVAHINDKTKSVQKIDIKDTGSNYKSTKIEIKGGGGTGASAYIEKISRGQIKSVFVKQRGSSFFDDPVVTFITDSEGSGAEAVAVVRGATGFTLTPSLSDADMYIVEKSLWNNGDPAGDYAAATNLAHELGHIFDLLHTYNGANETNNPQNQDYMSDLFGNNFSGYDVINWGKDPCVSSTDKVSNNLMGGNQTSQYTSPMQIGKMHKALHIYNVKKYTDCSCDAKKSWFISENEVWDFNIKLYNSIVVKSGSILTISCKLEMPDGCDITVESGAQLIIEETGTITGGCNKAWNGKLTIRKGADFKVKSGGKYIMENLGKLIIE